MTRVNVGRSVVTGRRPSNIKVAEDGQFKGTQPEINFTGNVSVTNNENNNRVDVNVNDTDLSAYLPSATAATTYQALINTPTVITDAAAISLTTAEHTLSTAQATITVTDSYTGDYCGLRLTLNGITQVVLTFSTGTALCAFNGTASGTNVMTVTGVAGDRIEIHRKKLGTNYTYVGLNVGQ